MRQKMLRRCVAALVALTTMLSGVGSTWAQATGARETDAFAQPSNARSESAREKDCDVCISRETAATCAAQDELISEMEAEFYVSQGREVACREGAKEERRLADHTRREHERERAEAKKRERRRLAGASFAVAVLGYVVGNIVGRTR